MEELPGKDGPRPEAGEEVARKSHGDSGPDDRPPGRCGGRCAGSVPQNLLLAGSSAGAGTLRGLAPPYHRERGLHLFAEAPLQGTPHLRPARRTNDACRRRSREKFQGDREYQRRIRETVDALLAAIPEADRILLMLKEVEGLSLSELSRVYGSSETALKVRLFRVRQRVLKTLHPLAVPASTANSARPKWSLLP